ncbi:MAG: hypothetical protein KAR83_01950, partial [Thermodesulfovibrionales bacterium]|nr:hypothetical protein [Thermodesulfovibrionales bacterium]
MYIKRINLKNEEGVALLMTLMVAAVVLAVMGSLMHMMVMGARISGLNKRFTTALEAGKGGQAIVLEFIGTQNQLSGDLKNSINWRRSGISSDCLDDKLSEWTKDWPSGCDALVTIDPGDDQTYDFAFDLDDYTVYSKIVNTIQGNTGAGSQGKAWGGDAVTGGGSAIEAVSVSSVYTIQLDARRSTASD